MQKTIYLTGNKTDMAPELVAAKFEKVQKELEAKGFKVITPIKIVDENNRMNIKQGFSPLKDWSDAMRACIVNLLTYADGIYLMPCWNQCPGAQLERDVARRLGIEVVYL